MYGYGNAADYIDINPKAKKTILMVHGWPAVWSTWGYQIEEFKVSFSTSPKFKIVTEYTCIRTIIA